MVACNFTMDNVLFNWVADTIQRQVDKIGKSIGIPLDQETLDRLTILWGDSLQLQPGESMQMKVGTVECCYVFEEVEARVQWSVQPTEGVSIDPRTGMLVVDGDTPHGSVYTVYADIERGRKTLELTINVYTREGNPLVGVWGETGQILCGTWEEVTPVEPIGELAIGANGELTVTWHPFEIYTDYHASYTYDLGQDTFSFETTTGNYIPPDLDTSGWFSIDEQGRLILTDIWFGVPMGSEAHPNCGHVFTFRY
jgi:hypothetical protein